MQTDCLKREGHLNWIQRDGRICTGKGEREILQGVGGQYSRSCCRVPSSTTVRRVPGSKAMWDMFCIGRSNTDPSDSSAGPGSPGGQPKTHLDSVSIPGAANGLCQRHKWQKLRSSQIRVDWGGLMIQCSAILDGILEQKKGFYGTTVETWLRSVDQLTVFVSVLIPSFY